MRPTAILISLACASCAHKYKAWKPSDTPDSSTQTSESCVSRVSREYDQCHTSARSVSGWEVVGLMLGGIGGGATNGENRSVGAVDRRQTRDTDACMFNYNSGVRLCDMVAEQDRQANRSKAVAVRDQEAKAPCRFAIAMSESLDRATGQTCERKGITTAEAFDGFGMGNPDGDQVETCGQQIGKPWSCRIRKWFKVYSGCQEADAGYLVYFSSETDDGAWRLSSCKRCTTIGCVDWPFKP